MLHAAPHPFHRRFFTWYFRRRLRRAFSGVYAEGIERLAPWTDGGGAEHPLVIVANHSSWWDAVLPIVISLGHFDHDAYGVMEGRQLQRYRFFRRLGMFSIDRDNPRAAMRSLDYGAGLLRGRRRVLWMFPQGEIVPNDRRPIDCYGGAERLIRMIGRCTVVPVAFRYELCRNERPTAWVSIGSAVVQGEGSSGEPAVDIPALLTRQVDALRDAVIMGRTNGFELLMPGLRSIDVWWDDVRGIARPEASPRPTVDRGR